MLQALQKYYKATNNMFHVNQTMAPRVSRGTMLYFEDMEEKGHKGFYLLIIRPVLKEFNIHQTCRMQLRRGNHQVIPKYYFKVVEGQSDTQDREDTVIERNDAFTKVPSNSLILNMGQYTLINIGPTSRKASSKLPSLTKIEIIDEATGSAQEVKHLILNFFSWQTLISSVIEK